MSRDRYDEAKRIFLEMVETPEPERESRLGERCGGDEELLFEVRALLTNRGRFTTGGFGAVAASAEPIDPFVGREFDGFRITRLVAEGGMGRVFEAEQAFPRRTVALKFLRGRLASPQAERRFRYEIEIVARLRHAGIACLYQAGTVIDGADRVPYFAMEFVPDAMDLRRHASWRRSSVREIVDLVARVCDAVDHGHALGVVHRDLKPENILVDPTGQPKVIDFGVSRLFDGAEQRRTVETAAGQLVGTLPYMSPEQCSGGARRVDSRSDVYSLGVVLFELLCGRPPFEVERLPLLDGVRRICDEAPPRPRALRKGLPRDLEAILLTALEKDPERRFATAGALASDLRRHLAGEPVAARRAPLSTRLVRAVWRRPLVATWLGSLVVAALVVGFGFVLSWWLMRAPGTIDVDPERSRATVRARAGHELKTWSTGARDRLRFAALLDRPAAFGGGRILALGLRSDAECGPNPGALSVFDAGDLDRPIWSTAATPAGLPPRLEPRVGVFDDVQHVLAADVIPESPGIELVAIHAKNPYSPHVIRVFDLAGRLRYQAWFDGIIPGPPAFLAPDTLVFAAEDCEFTWAERGVDGQGQEHPLVAVGLRVVDGHVERDRWLVRSEEASDETLLFCRWIAPTDALARIPWANATIGPIDGGLGRLGLVVLTLVVMLEDHDQFDGIAFLIDRDGVERERIVSDRYREAEVQHGLPPPSAIELRDYRSLPPRTR